MENLTYETYLANPEIRERLEREAHRARAEAVHLFIFAPLARLAIRMFSRAATKAAPGMRGSVAKIKDGRGARVHVELGSVWITQHGDPKDVFLRAGESFQVERNGLTLVSVLGNTAFARIAIDPATASA